MGNTNLIPSRHRPVIQVEKSIDLPETIHSPLGLSRGIGGSAVVALAHGFDKNLLRIMQRFMFDLCPSQSTVAA
jgi:hypothetical protein